MYFKPVSTVFISAFFVFIIGKRWLLLGTTLEIIILFYIIIGFYIAQDKPVEKGRFLNYVFIINAPKAEYINILEVYTKIIMRIMIYLFAYYKSLYFLVLLPLNFVYFKMNNDD